MDFGLCDKCLHQRIVRSGRGSVFSMCELGRKDPDWPKYPRMPVTRCTRYAERHRSATDPDARRSIP